MDIVAAYQQVGTYRGAAALCGTTHKTVRRVIERAQAGEERPTRKERTRNTQGVAEVVAARVAASQGRISAKRLLPAARTAGYEGSDRNFRRLVAQAKRDWRRDHHRGRRPAVWSPGEYLVIDWTDVGGGLHLFAAVLASSRFRFVRFATDERATTTMALIAEAFAEIGGVPAKVLADRMACLRGAWSRTWWFRRRPTCGSPLTTGSPRTSATPRTRRRRGSWSTWSATPSGT